MTNLFFLVFGLWLLILTALCLYLYFFLRAFFPQRKRGLHKLIETLFEKGEKNEKEQLNILTKILKLEDEDKTHLQKIGLVHFNPFERMGGEQSYTLAFLNKKDSGVVITFFYTKEGVRVYTKQIIGGKGKGVELSKEEEKAIAKAE
jgi:hypothetical protein